MYEYSLSIKENTDCWNNHCGLGLGVEVRGWREAAVRRKESVVGGKEVEVNVCLN